MSAGLSSSNQGSTFGLNCPSLSTSNASSARSNTSTKKNHTPSANPAAVDFSADTLLST
ncbi:hypothetical protein D3C80_2023330 [compost metagenome]